MIIKEKFSLVLHKNVCCGYSLESPRRGDSNEYLQHIFYGEMWKIIPKLSSNTILICSSAFLHHKNIVLEFAKASHLLISSLVLPAEANKSQLTHKNSILKICRAKLKTDSNSHPDLTVFQRVTLR